MEAEEPSAIVALILILASYHVGSMTPMICLLRFLDTRARIVIGVMVSREVPIPGMLGGLTTLDIPIFLVLGRTSLINND